MSEKIYRKPKNVPVIPGSGGGGYPVKDVGRKGYMLDGNYKHSPGMKKRMKMRGYGAATRGYMYYDED
jgi:hypothetical protein